MLSRKGETSRWAAISPLLLVSGKLHHGRYDFFDANELIPLHRSDAIIRIKYIKPFNGYATGPLGRNLEGDVAVRSPAAIYTYSKTKGLFAGVSIEGSALIERKDANKKLVVR